MPFDGAPEGSGPHVCPRCCSILRIFRWQETWHCYEHGQYGLRDQVGWLCLTCRILYSIEE